MSCQCSVCGGESNVVIDLPNLPLTDTYGIKPSSAPETGVDQQLLLCQECGHGQLATILSPDILYSSHYSFRTSNSATASAGTEVFLDFLERVAPGRSFRCVLDVGCNDLYLLNRLSSRAATRIGIDPLWAGHECEHVNGDIIVSGRLFEDAPLGVLLPEPPDLIVSRHTMEHIQHPVEIVRRMLDHASSDALLVIEVPGFDTLVRRHRYDQVFHQHIQYFSRSSLHRLLLESGAELVAMTENYHHWGAIIVAFRRARGPGSAGVKPWPSASRVAEGYQIFRRELEGVTGLVQDLGGDLYGYGAAQMLPVLAYHLRTDLSFLAAVLDDDEAKDGLGYWNLPVRVRARASVADLSEATVMITAIDNAAPIMRRLLEHRPKHIVTPMRII